MPRLFTLQEANAVLPRLRELLEDLRLAVAELEQAEAAGSELRRKVRGNGKDASDEPLARQQVAHEAVKQRIDRVRELGCELKDPRTGLIDFPSEREGRMVYLCWKLDEAEVSFWHPVETGFAGRQPL